MLLMGHNVRAKRPRSMDNTSSVDIVIAKANQALGMIKHNFKYMSTRSFMILYKTFVRPHQVAS